MQLYMVRFIPTCVGLILENRQKLLDFHQLDAVQVNN